MSETITKHAKQWFAVGTINDIPRQGARCVETSDKTIAIFRTMDDQIFALEDKSPHSEGPLSPGIVHGGFVTCPIHSWVVCLESGEAQGADSGRTNTYPIRIDGQDIHLQLEEQLKAA